MKYHDIQQYIGEGVYSVHTPWENFHQTYIVEHGLNVDPDYQRGHVWTEAQEIAYVEHILRGGCSGKDIYLNHPGWMKTFKGPFEVVDGKQRIKAAMRFMNNEIPVFGTFKKDFEDRLPWMTCEFIIHVNILKTRKEVIQWYLEMNTGGTVHTPEEIERVRQLLEKEKG